MLWTGKAMTFFFLELNFTAMLSDAYPSDIVIKH